MKGTQNIAASVRAKLLNVARKTAVPYNLILTRFSIERLLYRLCCSEYADRFVLKGASLFALWSELPHRSTRDLDLLGFGDSSLTALAENFRVICCIDVEDDGLRFDEVTVRAEQIKSLDEYVGARITIISFLGTARIPIQIDIGVGDAVVPSAEEVTYPTLLDHPAPRLKAYRMETVIAEKFHAMVVHGIMNTRLKDYFDVYYLSRNFNFDSRPIVEAIRATFERRGSNIPLGLPVGLTTKFSDDLRKIQQWEAFLRRVFDEPMTLSLSDVVEKIGIFVTPLLDVEGEHRLTWMAPGPWCTSDLNQPLALSQLRNSC